MSKERASFSLFFDSLDAFEHLSDSEFRQVFNAIVAYEKDGTDSLTGVLKAVFTPFKNNTDRAKDKYSETCAKNKKIAEDRWSTKSTTGKNGTNKVPTSTKSTNKDKDKDKDKDIKEEEEGDWDFINEVKMKHCGVKFTIDSVEYYFRDDGRLCTWNKSRAVTAPKALMLYKRMNDNQSAVLYHLYLNYQKVKNENICYS